MNHLQKYELVKQANPLIKRLAAIGAVAPHHALAGAGIGGLGNLALGDRDVEAWDRLLRGAVVGGGAGAATAIPTGALAVGKIEKLIEQNKMIQTLKALEAAKAKGLNVPNLF